jgi:hypothetical protein
MIVTKKSQVVKNSQPASFSWVFAKMISKAGWGNFHKYIPETDPCTIREKYGTMCYFS